jgi:ligand-binding sensor domain-containing protein/two-component sensor histidine kinase
MFRDSRGFLWVGTQQGLYRFDGAEAVKYDSSARGRYFIPNPDIRGIIEDNKNRIIVGTYGGGLLNLEKNSSKFDRLYIDNEPGSLYITGMNKIGSENFLAETRSGPKIIPLTSANTYKKGTNRTAATSFQNTVDAVAVSDFEYVIATKTRLHHLGREQHEIESLKESLGTSNISALAFSPPSLLYVGTSDARVIAFDFDLDRSVETLSLLSNEVTEINDLATVGDRLWIGTNGGLLSVDQKLADRVHLNTSNSRLSHNYVNTLLESDGILFIGTVDGVDQINPSSILVYNTRNSGIHNDVSAFSRSYDGTLWIGTYNGLYYMNNDRIHRKASGKYGLSLPEEQITALATDDRYLWIGLKNQGLYRLDIENMSSSHIPAQSLARLPITKILTAGGGLFVSTYGQGILKLSGLELVDVPTLGEEKSFILLHETRRGEIIAASESGIYFYDSEAQVFTPKSLEYPTSIKSRPFFLSVMDLENGDILFGTKDHGILKWKIEDRDKDISRITSFGNQTLTRSATVYSILIDKEKRAWSSTANGVTVLSDHGSLLFRLSSLDGLQADDFNFGAYYASTNGDFYFGGVNGYNRIDPSSVVVHQRPSVIVISEASYGQKKTILHSELSEITTLFVPRNSKYLNFNLALLDFTNIKRNQYKYKLQGFDPDWIDNGTNNKATYTSLPAGDYTFMAKGANAAGVWSEDSVSLRIKVLPPWWLTQWAYAFYTLCALCVVWGAMRVYRTKLLRQEAERRADEMHALADTVRDELQESQELQDGLVQSAYRHNTATIDLIKHISAVTAQSSGDDGLSGHLAAMEVLEKSYYFENAALAANLHEYIDGLCNLLLPRASVDPATISIINLATNSLIPAPVATPLAIILYELIDNALQHAFTARSAANFIQISLELKPATSSTTDTLTVIVQDDGIGLPSGLNVQAAPSKGFRVINALCGRLGGKLDVGLDSGTMISVCLPLYEETARYSN